MIEAVKLIVTFVFLRVLSHKLCKDCWSVTVKPLHEQSTLGVTYSGDFSQSSVYFFGVFGVYSVNECPQHAGR